MKSEEMLLTTSTESLNPDSLHEEGLSLKNVPLNWRTLWRFPFLLLIRTYQMTISRIIPINTCRFYPTCSHYSFQAVARYGALRGGLLSIWRVLRCNPFCRGGHDPVP
jgi:uncharacterized protein